MATAGGLLGARSSPVDAAGRALLRWAVPAYVALVWASIPAAAYGGLPSPVQVGGAVLLVIAVVRARARPEIAQPLLLIAALLALAATASGLLSSELPTVPVEWLTSLAFLVIVAFTVDGREGAGRVATALCLAAIFLGSGAAYSVLVEPTALFPLNGSDAEMPGLEASRAAGPFGEANFFALSLAAVVPFAVHQVVQGGSRRVIGLAAFACIAAGILAAGSRGATIAMVVTLLGSWIVIGGARLRWLLVAGAALAALALPFAAQLESAEERTVSGRAWENEVAVAMFLDHPIAGVGVGSYPLLFRDYSREVGGDPRVLRTPHSLPLEIAAEQGLAGIVAWLIAMLVLMRHVVERAVWGSRIGRACVLSLVGFSIGSLFLHGSQLRLLFVLVGLVLAVGVREEAR
jgi:O-antigen ligase